jgi:histidinol-phosphate/aromatic aminotransferase/cobyric acid decarboxylase-like protein
VGTYCLDQPEFVERTRERIATERERIRERLETRVDVAPSRAPFLLLDLGSGEAVEELCDSLRAEDIVIRDARSFRGLDSHVRVAVRRPDENDRLLDAIGV